MKVGDKIYCYKNYIDTINRIINQVDKEYYIVSINKFRGSETDVIVGITTNDITTNAFWIKYQIFNDGWDDMRERNIFSSYFLTKKEYRKHKLEKINECTK